MERATRPAVHEEIANEQVQNGKQVMRLAWVVTAGMLMSAPAWAVDDAAFLKEAVQGSIA
jgi:hypothetical protein